MAVIRSFAENNRHNLNRQCYVPRIIGSLLTGVLVATILSLQSSPWFIVPLILHAFIWPHIAYQITRFGNNSDHAELRNQYIEACLFGAWCVAFQYQFWPTMMLFCVTALNSIVCGGRKHMALCVLTHMAMIGVLGLLFKVTFQPESSMLTQAISATCLFGYLLFLGCNFRATITQMRLARQEIQKQRDESQRARHVAELQIQAKDEFLTNISHELHKPLEQVASMLSQAKQQTQSEFILNYVEKSDQALQNLTTIVGDILDFATIQKGILQKRCDSFSLDDMLNDIERQYGNKIRRRNIAFSLSKQQKLPERIFADRNLIMQSIGHLLNNAIKYTQRGRISVLVNILEQTGDELTLQFSVKDTGIGLSPTQINNLFATELDEINFDAEQINGLGLAITKHYVETMNGTIWVDSYYNHGSAFYFTTEVKLDAKLTHRSSAQHSQRVLIYSPFKNVLSKINQLISAPSCITHFALSSTQVLQQFSEPNHHFDAVLLIDDSIEKTEALAQNILAVVQSSRPVLLGLNQSLEEKEIEQAQEISVYKFDTLDNHLDAYLKIDGNGRELQEFIDSFHHEQNLTTFNELNNQHILKVDHNLAGLKALVVEDNTINQSIIRNILEEAEIEVITASNGFDALAMLQADNLQVDAILMDIQMPGKDGFATTEAIRNFTSEYANTPIIAISAHENESQIKQALSVGMNDYITKPIDATLLYNKIDYWVKESSNSPVSAG